MKLLIGLVGALLALVVLAVATAGAPAQGGYEIHWWTSDGGGSTTSLGRNYEVIGTVGQVDTGALVGGGFMLRAGFWGGLVEEVHRVFLSLVQRDAPAPTKERRPMTPP